MTDIPRKRCPVCHCYSPNYLYDSHLKQCKLRQERQNLLEQQRTQAALDALQAERS